MLFYIVLMELPNPDTPFLVVMGHKGEKRNGGRIAMWQREQAVNLFAQLPESLADKRLILDLMAELLEWTSQDAPRPVALRVVGGTSPKS